MRLSRVRRSTDWFNLSFIGLTAIVVMILVVSVWHEVTFRFACDDAGGVVVRYGDGGSLNCLKDGDPIDPRAQ